MNFTEKWKASVHNSIVYGYVFGCLCLKFGLGYNIPWLVILLPYLILPTLLILLVSFCFGMFALSILVAMGVCVIDYINEQRKRF